MAFIAAAAIAGLGAGIGGVLGGTATFLGAFGSTFLTTAISGLVSTIFSDKPKQPDFGEVATGISTMVRRPAEEARAVYGNYRISGPVVFMHTTDDDKWLHVIVTLAAHEVEAIDSVFFFDKEITIDSDGFTTDDEYIDDDGTPLIRIKKHLGSDTQTADTFLIADAPDKWTTDHRLRGNAYIYVKLGWKEGLWRNGIPNMSAVVSGKKLYDPRTTLTAFDTNPALVIYDYLTDTTYGMSVPAAEIDTTSFNTAANVCEESVALNGGGTEDRYTANGIVSTGNRPKSILEDILSSMDGILTYQNGTWHLLAGEYRTPTVTITESDIVAPMRITTKISRKSLFNTVKGIFVDPDSEYQPLDFPIITSATYIAEDNGEEMINDVSLPFTQSPASAQRLASIMLEKIRRQISLNVECNLKAFEVQVGDVIYLDNARMGWSAKTFEVLSWGFKLNSGEDGTFPTIGLHLKEIDANVYGWTSNEVALTAAPTTNLPDPFTIAAPTGLAVDAGSDKLYVKADGTIGSFARITWTASTDRFVLEGGKVEVQSKLVSVPSDRISDTSTLGLWNSVVILNGAQSSTNVSDIQDGATYDIRIRFANEVGIKSAWTTVTGIAASGKDAAPSDVTYLAVNQSDNQVTFSWPEVSDVDVRGYEIRYGPNADTNWANATPLVTAKRGNSETTAQIPPGDWAFFVKTVDTSGNYSDTATVAQQLVVNPNTIIDQLTDLQFFNGTPTDVVVHYSGGITPEDMKLASEYGFSAFNEFVPNPILTGSYVTEELDIDFDDDVRVWGSVQSELGPGVATGTANPTFNLCHLLEGQSSGLTQAQANSISSSGTLTNMVLHYGGHLTPESQSLASDHGFSTFDVYVPDPYANCEYEAVEIDLGSDRTAGFSNSFSEVLGPGETSGALNAFVEIDYRADADAYDGFETWTSGQIEARYIKHKIKLDTGLGSTVIKRLTSTVDCFQPWTIGDVRARTFQGRIAFDFSAGAYVARDLEFVIDKKDFKQGNGSEAIGSGGTTVTFDDQYHTAPRLIAVAQSSNARILTINNITTTSFDAKVFDSGGSAVSGTIDWEATGA